MNRSHRSILIFLALLTLDAWAWWAIIFYPGNREAFSMLDVGQGDAELMEFGGMSVLNDAGPDRSVLGALERSGFKSTTIDVAVVSHAEKDHFYGFLSVMERYRIGAFVLTGRGNEANPQWWNEFVAEVRLRKIPIVSVEEGDRIRYGEERITFLGPPRSAMQSAELNDTGLVAKAEWKDFSVLLAADINERMEQYLLREHDVSADVLKVGHHGSKYSSSDAFLKAVNPSIAVIGVGASNRYGHPAPQTLGRLLGAGAKVFRTDEEGNVRIVARKGALRVFVEH